MSVNVINYVLLENIYTMKIANVRKKLVDKLVEECTENVDKKEIYLGKLHSENTITPACSSYTIYIILFSLFFTIIFTYFIY